MFKFAREKNKIKGNEAWNNGLKFNLPLDVQNVSRKLQIWRLALVPCFVDQDELIMHEEKCSDVIKFKKAAREILKAIIISIYY